MSAPIWIDLADGTHNRVSNKACAFMFILMLQIDANNEVNKQEVFKAISWIKDSRTANKYWKELVDHGVLAKIKKKQWMVSPYECYIGGMPYTLLVEKWKALKCI